MLHRSHGTFNFNVLPHLIDSHFIGMDISTPSQQRECTLMNESIEIVYWFTQFSSQLIQHLMNMKDLTAFLTLS